MVYNLMGSSALSDDEGEILRAEIEKTLSGGVCVFVYFTCLNIVLAQFLNAAITVLYEKHNSEELRKRLVITGLKSTCYLHKLISRTKTFYANENVPGYVNRDKL